MDASMRQAQSELHTERRPTASDPTTALVNLLVKKGADVNAKDKFGMTPLDIATLKNNEAAVCALIENRANPNEKDDDGSTSLLKACIYCSSNLVRLLLSSGADCNVTDKWHNSVYHMVARHGRNDVLQLLINHAGKHAVELLWTTNDKGETPLELAVYGNHARTVNIILLMKPPGSDSAMFEEEKWLLHKAAEKGFLEVVKTLIQNGYNVRLRDGDKKLPLHAATISKRLDVVRYLLELAVSFFDDLFLHC
ncbi:ankyrin repeat protein [Ancylostoma caninum]|uniref:Ankyrin repeat protein n=1 Tax=Ancylostoma caninum TaxID=29170 RepID=A0A368G881_ANCCA|nr:ankyrin repeat protein [Ancylostoma caninum]